MLTERELAKRLQENPILVYDRDLLLHLYPMLDGVGQSTDDVPHTVRNGLPFWILTDRDETNAKIRKWQEKNKKTGSTRRLPPERPDTVTVPDAGMIGLARDFADLYTGYMESPKGFFFFGFLTYLGALVSQKVRLASALNTEPRMYTILLGETASSRKSTVIEQVSEFFKPLTHRPSEDWGPPQLSNGFRVLAGVGSAEGLVKMLETSPRILLCYDELRSLISKSRAESSVLLEAISTLFERGDVDQITTSKTLMIRGASVSILGACTTETFERLFDTRSLSMGLLNRLWVVLDSASTRFSVPREVPEGTINALRGKTENVLNRLLDGKLTIKLTEAGRKLFDSWYFEANRGQSIFEKRLDTYGHRLMVLLALTTGKSEVDTETVRAVLELLRYELSARQVTDPIDADNQFARAEERIRRALRSRGALRPWELRRHVNATRLGDYIFNRAVDNLVASGEVFQRSQVYHLVVPEDI